MPMTSSFFISVCVRPHSAFYYETSMLIDTGVTRIIGAYLAALPRKAGL